MASEREGRDQLELWPSETPESEDEACEARSSYGSTGGQANRQRPDLRGTNPTQRLGRVPKQFRRRPPTTPNACSPSPRSLNTLASRRARATDGGSPGTDPGQATSASTSAGGRSTSQAGSTARDRPSPPPSSDAWSRNGSRRTPDAPPTLNFRGIDRTVVAGGSTRWTLRSAPDEESIRDLTGARA